MKSIPNRDRRDSLELAQTANARYETSKAAAAKQQLDLERINTCGDLILEMIHNGEYQDRAMWILEISTSMLTAVMAVRQEPLPVAQQVDPASFALSVLRDLQTAAEAAGLEFPDLEQEAARCLKLAEKDGFSNQEVLWGINQATATLELAWAKSLAEEELSQTELKQSEGPKLDPPQDKD